MGSGGVWAQRCGAVVKARRKNLNLTLQQVADLAATTPQTVARAEAGTLVPRDHLRVALAFALFCEVTDLWPWPARSEVHQHAAAAAS